jgi:hypothetical protein
MALSSVEAEYMAASLAACEALWLRKLILGLFREELEATVILCDHQSCIKLSENSVFHDRSKHIDIRYHFIWDCVQRGVLRLDYIQNDELVRDLYIFLLKNNKIHKSAALVFPPRFFQERLSKNTYVHVM